MGRTSSSGIRDNSMTSTRKAALSPATEENCLRQRSRQPQMIWRGFLSFVDYSCSRQDVIVVQSLFRRNAARTLSTKRMQSIRHLQSGMRCGIAVHYLSTLRGQREEEVRLETRHRNFISLHACRLLIDNFLETRTRP